MPANYWFVCANCGAEVYRYRNVKRCPVCKVGVLARKEKEIVEVFSETIVASYVERLARILITQPELDWLSWVSNLCAVLAEHAKDPGIEAAIRHFESEIVQWQNADRDKEEPDLASRGD